MDGFQHKVGDRVVVEVSGTVVVRQENRWGKKYIIQPDRPGAESVHASPEYVFPEDGDEPTEATVIPLRRGPLPAALASLVDEVA
jgi:hypothetical protein